MSHDSDDIDLQLGALAHRTAGITPRRDFAERAMAAVIETTAPASGVLGSNTWRFGWRTLPVAAMAACAAFLLAMQSSASYEDALVTAYDDTSVELSW